MTSTDTLQVELEKFGLSKKQAQIYLALVTHKELRIQEIVTATGISRSSVRECLHGLFELGIVEEIIEEKFRKIKPYPISAIKNGLDEKLSHIERLKSDLDELEKAIDYQAPENSYDPAVLRYYKGRAGARQLFWNSLKAKEICVYSDFSRGRFVGIKYYERFVMESRERGIKDRVLVNMSPEFMESVKQNNYPGSLIARTKVENIRVINKNQMLITGDTLIYDNVFAQVYLKNIKINGFEIESKHFVESQQTVFETLWSLATPLTEILGLPSSAINAQVSVHTDILTTA